MRPRGALHHSWKGGRIIAVDGYAMLNLPDHPRANSKGYVREHLVIVERALGHSIPPKAETHHVDDDRSNNGDGNLVLCEDRSYHRLLERRMKALKACGNPNALKCTICKSYDGQSEIEQVSNHFCHRDCYNADQRRRYRIRRSTRN